MRYLMFFADKGEQFARRFDADRFLNEGAARDINRVLGEESGQVFGVVCEEEAVSHGASALSPLEHIRRSRQSVENKNAAAPPVPICMTLLRTSGSP